MRSTHTIAILEVPPAAWEAVKAAIDKVNQNGDYNHMFLEDGVIDMTHIGLQKEKG